MSTKDNDKYVFCEIIEELSFADIDKAAIDYARYDLIDTLGVSLAGATSPGIDEIITLHNAWEGKPESSVWGRGCKLPAPSAAMVNGAMAHALDFDDTLDFAGNIHIGASVIPAVLAMADRAGGVSGKDLLTGIAAGMEVSSRLAEIATDDIGWHRTGAFGIFGATVAACKIMGMEAPMIREALGIALSQASGTRQCILDGALTKRLQAGFAASNAVTSAIYAEAGLTGAQDPFWGKYGFFEMYQGGKYDRSKDLSRLGEKFLITELSFKPYPCGRPTHKFVLAAIRAYEEMVFRKLALAQISKISVQCSKPVHERHMHNSNPDRVPENQIEAQFHVCFLIASALVNGKFGLNELENIDQETTLSLMDVIEWNPVESDYSGDVVGVLYVEYSSGDNIEIDISESSVAQPSSSVGKLVADKFESCIQYAVGTPGSKISEQLLEIMFSIEDMRNSTELTTRLLEIN